jgi:hypothetical protein
LNQFTSFAAMRLSEHTASGCDPTAVGIAQPPRRLRRFELLAQVRPRPFREEAHRQAQEYEAPRHEPPAVTGPGNLADETPSSRRSQQCDHPPSRVDAKQNTQPVFGGPVAGDAGNGARRAGF